MGKLTIAAVGIPLIAILGMLVNTLDKLEIVDDFITAK
jgi:hypothetical protein